MYRTKYKYRISYAGPTDGQKIYWGKRRSNPARRTSYYESMARIPYTNLLTTQIEYEASDIITRYLKYFRIKIQWLREYNQ